MSKVRGYNGAEYTGYVFSFKITTSERTGKRRAQVGIKDERMNNVAYGTIFETANLKYGEQKVSLLELQKIFLDDEGKSRHIMATFSGTVADNEYINSNTHQTVTNVQSIFFKITPCADESKQQIMFNITGIVDAVKEVDNGDAYLAKIGIVTTDRDKNPTGIVYNRIKISGDAKDTWDKKDVSKGDLITLRGYNLNVVPLDEFGLPAIDGKVVKELSARVVGGHVVQDDLDDYDSVYVALKKGTYTKADEQLPFNMDSELNDDELFG